jgi:hypothetical protein
MAFTGFQSRGEVIAVMASNGTDDEVERDF